MVNIGLPKGNLLNSSCKIIKRALNTEISPGKLCFQGNGVRFVFLKHKDIPLMLQNHKLDYGITSSDWVMEKGYNGNIIKELEWCKTRISLIASAKISNDAFFAKENLSCVSEFPNITHQYFKQLNINVTVLPISGSSEAFIPHLYDCCVDCVETGETLRANNLREIGTIILSNINLYSNCASVKPCDNEKLKKLLEWCEI